VEFNSEQVIDPVVMALTDWAFSLRPDAFLYRGYLQTMRTLQGLRYRLHNFRFGEEERAEISWCGEPVSA